MSTNNPMDIPYSTPPTPGMIISFGRKPIKRFFVVSILSSKKRNEINLRVLENLNHLNMLFPATGPDESLMNTGSFIKYLKM
jgi:hypothetical protein